MDKVKHRFKNLPILPVFVLLSTVFILIAMLFVEVEKTVLHNAQREIVFEYTDRIDGFNGIRAWADNTEYYFSEADSNKIQTYEMLTWLLPPLTYLLCMFFASWLFYIIKLKKPLHILSTSTAQIANNNLDFVIAYDKTDEMGQLCSTFERMRSILDANNREMWRQMDDRKRLNAAFSHDLRTPLTVLEGHLNILQKYASTGKLSADEINGFEAVALKAATDPFYTTEKKADSQHFGLGLNICKILCLRHGGQIVLNNRSSGGASVTATFGMKEI